jgi:hypothetical protein
LSEQSDDSPAIAVLPTGLWIAWTGTDNALNYMKISPPTLSTKTTLSEQSDDSLSITGKGDFLWIAWKGIDNALNVMDAMNPSSKMVFEESDEPPSISTFRNSIWIAWKGIDNALNVMDVFDQPNTKITFGEQSDDDASPSIDSFQVF